MDRREFLGMSAAAGAYAFLGTPWQAAAEAGEPEPWFDKPMRWAQLVLVENDPGRFDPDFWLDYFKRVHADAACLSAGGIVAYYPTKVPLHHRSAWLGDSDPFGYLVQGCRKMGMAVIARTDPHAAWDNVAAGPPGLDRRRCPGPAATPLGESRAVGHLCAGPVQLRVHDRRSTRRSWSCTGSTASSPTAGRAMGPATASTA